MGSQGLTRTDFGEMAAVAASLSHANPTSRMWNGQNSHLSHVVPLCRIAGKPKRGTPAFLIDSKEVNAFRFRRMRLDLAKASPRKDNTREADHSVDFGSKTPFRSEQDTDDHQAHVQEDRSEADVTKRLHLDAHESVSGTEIKTIELKGTEGGHSNANGEATELMSGDTALKGSIMAVLTLVGVVGGIGAVSYLYRNQINDFLIQSSDFIEGYGTAGYAIFVAVYAGLEILAIPAIPLTMSAGLLFGTFTGTIIVSASGTIAATAAFLIARYLARDRILKLAEGNKKFLAIDKAIGEKGFRIVTLLRLSPLLPFSIGNYLYGLTSVRLVPYIMGSWLGMLPGTWAYVSAGAVGRVIIQEESGNGISGGPEQLWTIGLGLLVTLFAATYVTRLAKDAIKDIE